MARRYNNRRNSSNSTTVLVLLGVAVGYSNLKELSDEQIQLLTNAVQIIAVIIVLVFGYIICRSIHKLLGARKQSMSKVDSMNGVSFEYYLASLLRKQGYKNVRLTEKYDLGIDIIAKKDGIAWGIQTKRHNNLVKVAAVRQAYTALAHYKCDRAMVVTNSTFSNPATVLARETNTVLVDRRQLAKWI